MLKIKIHPTFILFAIVLILGNNYIFLLSNLFCILIHEWAHAKMAYYQGYYLNTINIMPYGAMISTKETFDKKGGLFIACAGPLSNIALCIILLAVWWISPVCYNYTKILFNASLSLAFFNILPIFPLDGSRIILSLSKNVKSTIIILKAFGFATSGILAILFFTSFFFSPNINLGIISAILYISTINDGEKETYQHLCSHYSISKNKNVPIKKTTLVVHQNLKLIRLIKHITPNTETIFEIVDDDLKLIKSINEQQLLELAYYNNIHLPIKEFLYL